MFNRNKKLIEVLEKENQRLTETTKELERRINLLEKREMQNQLNGVDFSQKW